MASFTPATRYIHIYMESECVQFDWCLACCFIATGSCVVLFLFDLKHSEYSILVPYAQSSQIVRTLVASPGFAAKTKELYLKG